GLRAKPPEVADIPPPEVIHQDFSSAGTRKRGMRMPRASRIETVFRPDGDRGTPCVSSRTAWTLGCSSCSTAKQGFNRHLSADEIIGQVWIADRSFGEKDSSKKRHVTNVVMMGMGEPLLNFDNVVDAMSLMLDDFAYGLSKRRVTLSTAGVVPALDKLGDVIDVSLAISLHAPNDELRSQLVPINKKYPIQQLLDACNRYLAKCDDKRRVTVEYTLI